MTTPTLITIPDAAREKGVSRQAVSDAIKRGSLTAVWREGSRLIKPNGKYILWLSRGMDWRKGR